MKACTRCGEVKSASAFSPNRRVKSGLASWCKVCTREASSRWKAQNPEKMAEHVRRYRLRYPEWYQAALREWKLRNPENVAAHARESYERHRDERVRKLKERRDRQRAVLDAYKRDRGCVDCGTSEGKLDFDHRPHEDKLFAVAQGVGSSWERLWAEVVKCDVRCASCHWHRHATAGDIHVFGSAA